ncbi:hypothetical protein ACP70R_025024 [Stipagrostis hirtigluma subsp. patula]
MSGFMKAGLSIVIGESLDVGVICEMGKTRERHKERDGFFNWGDADDGDKHFFKIMVGECRERMIIPEFVLHSLHFQGKLTKTMKLESNGGYTFDVQIIKNQNKELILQSGWKAFANAHDLKIGDFLVFKYAGISKLKVLIFDPSGCEKLPSSLVMRHATHCGKRREETVEMSSNRQSHMKSPRNGAKASKDRILNISSSSSSFELSGDVTSSEDDLKEHSAPSYILKGRTRLTDEQKKAMKAKIRVIRSEIPVYGCIINKNSLYGKPPSLDLSREYADVYLPFVKKTLMLRRHGKIWKVQSYGRQDRTRRLSSGWKRFAVENDLQMGDFCLFELLKDKKYTMNVHVIREN